MNENIKKILRFGNFKDIDKIFQHYKKKRRFSEDIAHYAFLRFKKSSFKYKKYIREFQKKLTESKKSYPHNKKYFDLTSKKISSIMKKFFCLVKH